MMAANYRHIGGGENRVGRHYSRFWTSGPAAPLAAHHLPGENRRTAGRIGEVGLRWSPAPRKRRGAGAGHEADTEETQRGAQSEGGAGGDQGRPDDRRAGE